MAKRRSVWVVEFLHQLGWTPFRSENERKWAFRHMRLQREIRKEWKYRVIRYDASK